jgi:hypothetical protein
VEIISKAIFSGLNPSPSVLTHKDTGILFYALIGCINNVRRIAHFNLGLNRPIYYQLIAEEYAMLKPPAAKKRRTSAGVPEA